MSAASHTFHGFLQPSDASSGSATPSSGSSSPEVFFDAADQQLSATMLPTTPTHGPVSKNDEFYDALETPAASVNVYIEDCRSKHDFGDQEQGEAEAGTEQNELFNFDGHTKANSKGKPKARHLQSDFLPKRQLSNNLREETRKIVQMLSNDKVCKIDRPSLGLQDRLQSLVQRSAGKRISYVKGPRVCSTLVKSIVKRTQESMYLRRTSFQGYPGRQDERPPLPVFNKPIHSYIKATKCTKASERGDAPLRGSQETNQISNVKCFETIIKSRKGNNNASSDTIPDPASQTGKFSDVTNNDYNTGHQIFPNTTFTGENVHVTSTFDLSLSKSSDFGQNLINIEFKISVPFEADDLDTPEATNTRPGFPEVADDADFDEMEFTAEPLPDSPLEDAQGDMSITPNLDTTSVPEDPPNKQTEMKTKVVSQNLPSLQSDNSSTLTNGHDKQANLPSAKSESQVTSGGFNAPPPPRQRVDSMTNGVIDLRKHIESLNKVSLTFGARNRDCTNDEKDAAAKEDSLSSPKPSTALVTSQPPREVKLETTEVAEEKGIREQVVSSSPGNVPRFHTATAIANLSVPLYKSGDALQRRPSPPGTSKPIQRRLSTRDLLYSEEDIQSSVPTHSVLHTETLMRLRTENLMARHGGTSSLHPYPAIPSPRQPSPAPAPDTPSQRTVPESKEKAEATPDVKEGLPPLPPNVQRVKRQSVSRQASKEETAPTVQRNVSRKESLEYPCPSSRKGSHLLQGSCSRRGSRIQSFSQDTLRKCLIAAVDQCYNTEWEETSDSTVVRDDSMSQDEVNKALVKAVCHHDAEKVRMMLKLSADPNVKCNNTPVLLRAARDGALYVMQALLAAGADVDMRSDVGNSPLHLAARGGYSEVAVQLVHSGAFVDAVNRSGITPLQMALAHGHVDVARSLLRLNADMFLQNKVGETAYDVASMLGYIGLSGAPREIRRDSGVGTKVEPCPNEVPVAVRLIQGIEVGCAGTVDDCLREGASPNTVLPLALHWPAHASVLHRAAHHGHDLIVRLLLAAGADIQARDVVGNTPLHVAAQAGHNRVVKLLLEHGASKEAVSQSGMSPLHRAASKGKEFTCNLLIRRGANPRAEDSSGRTPADWAWKRGFKHLSQKLGYRRKSSATLQAEDDGRLDLEHLHRLHEAALKDPRQSPEPMECEE